MEQTEVQSISNNSIKKNNFTKKPNDEYALENELDNYVEENGLINCSEIAPIARHFAQWGAEHLKH